MFLKNFWEYVRVQSLYTDQFNTGSVTQKPCSIKASDGFNFSQMYIDAGSASGTPQYYPSAPTTTVSTIVLYFRHLFYGFIAHVGTGETEVTPFDYCLANNVDSSFDQTSTTQTYSTNEAGHFVLKITWTGHNKTNSAVTIKEIGATKWMCMYSGGYTGSHIYVARHVLTTPITVDAGASATIIFECEIY